MNTGSGQDHSSSHAPSLRLHTLERHASHIIDYCTQKNLRIATAESCTGGLLASVLTDISGSSAVFERGFITYSNLSKSELLDIPGALIERFGAVSREVALAMALGALHNSQADYALSVTGIAGPTGGTPDKPVGLVHFGLARRNGLETHREQRFSPSLSRQEIRLESVGYAFLMLDEAFSMHNY